ncbi:10512_t:CDS:2, partial [Racocetra persica]
ALIERIIRAYKNNEKFRVIVIMPLVPGFEGQFDAESAVALRITMEFEYHTICRGDGSIFGRLKKAGIQNPEEYISFYALRAYDKIDSEAVKKAKDKIIDRLNRDSKIGISQLYPIISNIKNPIVTEQIYIHSKLMIVDDQIVICGSGKLFECMTQKLQLRDNDKVDSKLAGKD